MDEAVTPIPEVGGIKQIMARRLGVNPGSLSDDMTLEALGLDSLALAESIVAVEEHYGVQLDVGLLAEQVSPLMALRDLLEAVSLTVAQAGCGAGTGSRSI